MVVKCLFNKWTKKFNPIPMMMLAFSIAKEESILVFIHNVNQLLVNVLLRIRWIPIATSLVQKLRIMKHRMP